MDAIAKLVSDFLIAQRAAKLNTLPAPVAVQVDVAIAALVNVGAYYADQFVTKLVSKNAPAK